MSEALDSKVACYVPRRSALWTGTAMGQWDVKEGHICEDAHLTMQQAPPALSHPSAPAPKTPPAPPTPKRKLTEGERMANLVGAVAGAVNATGNQISNFRQWLDSPPPSPPAKRAKRVMTSVKEFDLQYLPGAMDNMHLPKSAFLLRK